MSIECLWTHHSLTTKLFVIFASRCSEALVAMGYNRSEIEASLSQVRYDDVFATYLLLGRKSTDVSWFIGLDGPGASTKLSLFTYPHAAGKWWIAIGLLAVTAQHLGQRCGRQCWQCGCAESHAQRCPQEHIGVQHEAESPSLVWCGNFA